MSITNIYKYQPKKSGHVNQNPPRSPTHHHQFSKALKFTHYTYHSSSIGQSTLALALLVLKLIIIYLKIRIFRLDMWIIGVHAILVLFNYWLHRL
jgi:hypothetical protein